MFSYLISVLHSGFIPKEIPITYPEIINNILLYLFEPGFGF